MRRPNKLVRVFLVKQLRQHNRSQNPNSLTILSRLNHTTNRRRPQTGSSQMSMGE